MADAVINGATVGHGNTGTPDDGNTAIGSGALKNNLVNTGSYEGLFNTAIGE